MLNPKLKVAAVTSLIWIVCLSSCASLTIKTWFLDGKDHVSLIRKNSDGSIKEAKSFPEAHGFLCYSPQDDEAWRTYLAAQVACCNGK